MTKNRAHLFYAGILLLFAFAAIGTLIYFHRQNQQNQQNLQDTTQSKSSQLDGCLNAAEQEYNNYLRINAKETKTDPETGEKLGLIEQHTKDNAEARLKSDRDSCFKRYPTQD